MISLQKCFQEKTLVLIILNSQKIEQYLVDLFGSKKPTGEIYFERCFELLKRNNLEQIEKSQQVYLSKNKKKHYRQSVVRIFTMLKNLVSYPYVKPNLAKKQLRISSSTSVIEYMK